MPGSDKKPTGRSAMDENAQALEAMTSSGSASTLPTAKRQRAAKQEVSDSDSETSDAGGDDSPSASTTTGSGRADQSARINLRKEKKSAREKARRQRENALFEELANICNVPPDMRDKSSVLKAVIKRVEELKTRSNGSGFAAANSLLSALTAGNISPSSSFGSLAGLTSGSPPQSQPTAPIFDDMFYSGSRTVAVPGSWSSQNGAAPFPLYPSASGVVPSSSTGGPFGLPPPGGAFHTQFPQQVMGPPPVTGGSQISYMPPLGVPSAVKGNTFAVRSQPSSGGAQQSSTSTRTSSQQHQPPTQGAGTQQHQQSGLASFMGFGNPMGAMLPASSLAQGTASSISLGMPSLSGIGSGASAMFAGNAASGGGATRDGESFEPSYNVA